MFQWAKKETTSKASRGNVPTALRQKAEQKSGLSLQDVRVHYNSPEPSRFQAFGYALGEDIYLAPGREQDLPHELWHVVQQKQGRVHPVQRFAGENLNTDFRLEQEADQWQRINELRYPQRQAISCVQRRVYIGEDQDPTTYNKFLDNLAVYCYKHHREKEKVLITTRLKQIMQDAYDMIYDHVDECNFKSDHFPIYHFDSYEDFIKKLLLKHRSGRNKVIVGNVGQGESIMLEQPQGEVIIDMGKTGTAETAFRLKNMRKKNKDWISDEAETIDWREYMLKLNKIYPKYCAYRKLIFLNSECRDFASTLEEGLFAIDSVYYNEVSPKSKYDLSVDEINEGFWNWKPNNDEVLLDDIRRFYTYQQAFCKYIVKLSHNYLENSETILDKLISESPEEFGYILFSDFEKADEDFILPPHPSEISNASESTNASKFPDIALTEEECNFILDVMNEFVKKKPTENASTKNKIVAPKRNIALETAFELLKSELTGFFERYRMKTDSFAAVEFMKLHSWSLYNKAFSIANNKITEDFLWNTRAEEDELWEEICENGSEDDIRNHLYLSYSKHSFSCKSRNGSQCWTHKALVNLRPIITHDHDDHNGGLSREQVLVLGAQDLSERYDEIKDELQKRGLNIIHKKPEKKILPFSFFRKKPAEGQAAKKVTSDKNFDSLMLYHDCGDCRIYFLGDSPLENLIKAQLPPQLSHHVLCFPHHGSVTANGNNTPIRLMGQKKTFGIVSASAGNKYGLPSYQSLTDAVKFENNKEYTGRPKRDGTCMTVAEYLKNDSQKVSQQNQGLVVVRYTMNLGELNTINDNTGLSSYDVVDISADGKEVVFYSKKWVSIIQSKLLIELSPEATYLNAIQAATKAARERYEKSTALAKRNQNDDVYIFKILTLLSINNMMSQQELSKAVNCSINKIRSLQMYLKGIHLLERETAHGPWKILLDDRAYIERIVSQEPKGIAEAASIPVEKIEQTFYELRQKAGLPIQPENGLENDPKDNPKDDGDFLD